MSLYAARPQGDDFGVRRQQCVMSLYAARPQGDDFGVRRQQCVMSLYAARPQGDDFGVRRQQCVMSLYAARPQGDDFGDSSSRSHGPCCHWHSSQRLQGWGTTLICIALLSWPLWQCLKYWGRASLDLLATIELCLPVWIYSRLRQCWWWSACHCGTELAMQGQWWCLSLQWCDCRSQCLQG